MTRACKGLNGEYQYGSHLFQVIFLFSFLSYNIYVNINMACNFFKLYCFAVLCNISMRFVLSL